MKQENTLLVQIHFNDTDALRDPKTLQLWAVRDKSHSAYFLQDYISKFMWSLCEASAVWDG